MKIETIKQQIPTARFNTNVKQRRYPIFKAIYITDIANKYKGLESTLKKETEKFSQSGNNVQYLGRGLSSEVFEFINLKNIVIKRPFNKDYLIQEMNALQAVPEVLKGTQKFIARTYDDICDKYYLLSTKVNGKSAKPAQNPWNNAALRSLFDGMFELDKAGLYHGDLNNGNIKIDAYDNVNFLDFQWGTIVSPIRFFEINDTQCMPNFMYLQNSQMFEMAEVPYYLKCITSSSQAKAFMKEYLEKKSKYHQNRIHYIENITSKWPYSTEKEAIKIGLDFEKAQVHVYGAPDENTIKLETLKIQFLNAFRESTRHLDANTPHKNILAAPSSYLVAFSYVQALRKEIYRQENNCFNYSYKRDYLKGMKLYADYWYNNLSEWIPNTFSYPLRHATKNIEPGEILHNFNDAKVNIEEFKPMSDIAIKVDPNYAPKYEHNYNISTKNTLSYLLVMDFNMNKVNSYKAKIAYKKFKDAFVNNRGMDAINAGLLLIHRLSECYDFGINYARDLTKMIFEIVYNETKNQNISRPSLYGYNEMNNFK